MSAPYQHACRPLDDTELHCAEIQKARCTYCDLPPAYLVSWKQRRLDGKGALTVYRRACSQHADEFRVKWNLGPSLFD